MLFPAGTFPVAPQLATKKALLLLDFQTDFTSSTGRLPVNNVKSFLSRLPELTARFREKGQVVWVRTEYRGARSPWASDTGGYTILLKDFIDQSPAEQQREPSPEAAASNQDEHPRPTDGDTSDELKPDPEAFLADRLPPGYERCCRPGTTGAEMSEELRVAVDTVSDMVKAKCQYSAFADMTLLLELRTRMVTDLYLAGSLSNISVYATALDAVRHGFQVTVIEDCLGYRDDRCHLHAMRHMADHMGVEGIDYQELLDDLAGLLGDVIREEDYTTRFQVDTGRPAPADQKSSTSHDIQNWIKGLQEPVEIEVNQALEEDDRTPLKSVPDGSPQPPVKNESPPKEHLGHLNPQTDSSPSRKRSTEDVDESVEALYQGLLRKYSERRSDREGSAAKPEGRLRKSKVKVRRNTQTMDERKEQRPATDEAQALKEPKNPQTVPPLPRSPEATTSTPPGSRPRKRLDKKSSQYFLGPGDPIGDGSSRIVHNILIESAASRAFHQLKSGTAWQKMYHRSGEVPRLVAVQGDMIELSSDSSTTYPIYRHPADESPELRSFDATVHELRKICEKHVGHTLNHVLIQHYRSGDDNISEHSDKTLDVVRGSSIVNLSLGAMRTMTLRTKRAEGRAQTGTAGSGADALSPLETGPPRLTQRVRLPHNSLFVLSSTTNAKFLHAVRADKRADHDKTEAELDYGGERISLTFRHIGTFITRTSDGGQLIWGQGATGKTRSRAHTVLGTETAASHDDKSQQQQQRQEPCTLAQEEGERMIIGFGKENQEGDSFDWDKVYGRGFDVVNFVTKPAGG